jgi:hypothetical protein
VELEEGSTDEDEVDTEDGTTRGSSRATKEGTTGDSSVVEEAGTRCGSCIGVSGKVRKERGSTTMHERYQEKNENRKGETHQK